METLGKRLKRLREKKHLSITFMAEQLSVSPSTYREWEYGRAINGEPYMKLANIYGVSLTYLLTGVEPESETLLNQISDHVKSLRNLL